MSELLHFFRPEFLNRLDDIIEFHPVSKDMLADIITIQLENFKTFVQKEKNIALQFDDTVISMLAEK